MDFILGSLITLLCIFVLTIKTNKIKNVSVRVPVMSQSRKYFLINQILFKEKSKSNKRQSTNKINKDRVRGIVVENEVYWIERGRLVSAQLLNGKIDYDSKKIVDTYGLSGVELDRVIFIVDKLNEGKNDDSSNSGY